VRTRVLELLARQASALPLGQVWRARLYLTRRLRALAVVAVSEHSGKSERNPDLGDHADDEALLLDAVRLYRIRILENLACSSGSASVAAGMSSGEMPGSELTGVDELLLGNLPALVRLDLFLEGANLCAILAVLRRM
tara:strand:+ start:2147 stop:2560 length:414 start_codon:yes stop_codon:yes gene_type:complete